MAWVPASLELLVWPPGEGLGHTLDGSTASAVERLTSSPRKEGEIQDSQGKLGYHVDEVTWSNLVHNLSGFSGNCQWVKVKGESASSRFQIALGKAVGDELGASFLVVDSITIKALVAVSRVNARRVWRRRSEEREVDTQSATCGVGVDRASKSLHPTQSLLDYRFSTQSMSSQPDSTTSASTFFATSPSSSPQSNATRGQAGARVPPLDFVQSPEHIAWLPQSAIPTPRELRRAARAVWISSAKMRSSAPVVLLLPEFDELAAEYVIFVKELWRLTSGGAFNGIAGVGKSNAARAVLSLPLVQVVDALGGKLASTIFPWCNFALFVVATSKSSPSLGASNTLEWVKQVVRRADKLWPSPLNSLLPLVQPAISLAERWVPTARFCCNSARWMWQHMPGFITWQPVLPFDIEVEIHPKGPSTRQGCIGGGDSSQQSAAAGGGALQEWRREQEDDLWMDTACAVTGYLKELSHASPEQGCEEPQWTLFPTQAVRWTISWTVGFLQARAPWSFPDEKPSMAAFSQVLLADIEPLRFGLFMALVMELQPPAIFDTVHIRQQQFHEAQAASQVLGKVVQQLLSIAQGSPPCHTLPVAVEDNYPSHTLLAGFNSGPSRILAETEETHSRRGQALLPAAGCTDRDSSFISAPQRQDSVQSTESEEQGSRPELERGDTETPQVVLHPEGFCTDEHDHRSKILGLEEGLRDLGSRLSGAVRSREQAIASMEIEQNHREAAQQQVVLAVRDLHVTQAELAATAAALEQLKAAHCSMQGELQVVQTGAEEAVARLGQLQHEHDSLQKQLTLAQDQLRTREGELQAAVAASQRRIVGLQEEKRIAAARIAQAQAELADCQAEVGLLKADLSSKETAMLKERAQLLTEHESTLAQLRRAQEDVLRREEELQAAEVARQQRVTGLELQRDEAQAEVLRSQAELAQVTLQVQRLREEVDENMTTLQLERGQHDSAMAQKDAKIGTLEGERQSAVALIRRMQAQVARLQSQLQQLTSQHAGTKSELEAVSARLESADEAASKSRSENLALQQTRQELEVQATLQKRELRRLRKKVADLSLFGPLGFACSVVLVVKVCQVLSAAHEPEEMLLPLQFVTPSSIQPPRSTSAMPALAAGSPVRPLMSFASFGSPAANRALRMERISEGPVKASRPINRQGSLQIAAHRNPPMGMGGSGLRGRRPMSSLQELELESLP